MHLSLKAKVPVRRWRDEPPAWMVFRETGVRMVERETGASMGLRRIGDYCSQ